MMRSPVRLLPVVVTVLSISPPPHSIRALWPNVAT